MGCFGKNIPLTPRATVARIAYLSSDVVISVQPALSVESEFSKHLHKLAAAKRPGLVAKELPEVRPIENGVTIHADMSCEGTIAKT